MQTITPRLLKAQGYTEDPEGRKLLDRPSKLPNGVLALVFCASIVGVETGKLAILPALWTAVGVFLTLFVIQVLAYRSTPRSRFTGKPLRRYKNAKPDRHVLTELIYVCEDSKTFFRLQLDYSDSQLPFNEEPLTRIPGLPQIHRLPELKEAQEAQVVVRPVFGSRPPFSLFPSDGQRLPFNTPFSSEDPSCSFALSLFYFLDPVFFLFYAFATPKQILNP
jgi:hypothetical protein